MGDFARIQTLTLKWDAMGGFLEGETRSGLYFKGVILAATVTRLSGRGVEGTNTPEAPQQSRKKAMGI